MDHNKPPQLAAFDGFFKEFQRQYLLYRNAPYIPVVQDGDIRRVPIIAAEAESFFSNFSALWEKEVRQGSETNIWSVAGLKRDEVRNSAVLAWLLDSQGSHGQGNLFLRAISSTFSEGDNERWKKHFKTGARVYLESCPQGDQESRVDIEIEGPEFLFFIEVKIDSGEQDQQIQRYFEIAKQKAGNRPFSVSFLTPSGRAPKADGLEEVICFSWKDCAQAFADAVEKDDFLGSPYIKQIVTQFCDHIYQF